MTSREELIEALKRTAHVWDSYDFDHEYDYTEEANAIADVVFTVFGGQK